MKNNIIFYLLVTLLFIQCKKPEPPKAVGAIPSKRQLAWHDLEYYGFIHFNMNTFTDMEWGTGGELPKLFNPSNLDCRQWARIAKESGMKGLILTAKHHDGFCLWPTATTEHSVKNSPWKNGQGDVVKELREACDEYGLKLGLYLSPWDRNNADYGNDKYVAIFHEQLRELLTNYGELFEFWFDGANGGTGYYGGTNENRKIDNKTYYQWDVTTAIIRELQPNACIFGDGGPDVRWVGNEEGWAKETNWSIMYRDSIYPGWPKYKQLQSGHENGSHWLPAEADVSIRPGWYYHASEDHQVKSLRHLMDIYYQSIGRNAALLLNLPVDKRGLIHENDEKRLLEMKKQLDLDFEKNLAQGQNILASDTRENNKTYKANNVLDDDKTTYWATNNGVTQASLTLHFKVPTTINRLVLQEFIALGQRVKTFMVEVEVNGTWQTIGQQTTIGYKRILRFDDVMVNKLRVNFLEAKGAICISNLEVYRAPKLLVEPKISRDRLGMVNIVSADKNVETYYTLDGIEPSTASKKYKEPFKLESPAIVKAISYDSNTKQQSDVGQYKFDIAKTHWKILHVPSKEMKDIDNMIDGNPNTLWMSNKTFDGPQDIIIDLGKVYKVKGFTYWPDQRRWFSGLVVNYSFFVSENGKTWKLAKKGEFSNIKNNRIEQQVAFIPTQARYIKLRADRMVNDDKHATFAEIGVLTE